MVADNVEVVSRRAGSDEAWRWSSDGMGSYEIAPASDEDAPVRGTKITLYLKEDEKSFADPVTIRRVVREYSSHVPVPIRLMSYNEEAKAIDEEELTDGSALWIKPKSEITEEQYTEFYQHTAGQFDNPALTIHYRAEGRTEYNVLAFVPEHKPFDLFDPNRKGRMKLYVRRVFITDDADVLPAYLRFVRGVVDSEDIPLNISREMLQDNPILNAISKGVTNRVLSELEKLANKEEDKFASVWEAFGPVIKEGLYEDPERRDQLFKLVRFNTTKGDNRTLAQYVEDLKENQTAIYYALGDSKEAIMASPQLEGYQARMSRFCCSPMRWMLSGCRPLSALMARASSPFPRAEPIWIRSRSRKKEEDKDKSEEDKAKEQGDVAELVTFVKETLGDAVSDVRISARLATSPVCIVAPDYGPDRQLEKLMRSQKGADAALKPVLEINPITALSVCWLINIGGQ